MSDQILAFTHKLTYFARTFVFGLVLLILPIACVANNPPTVWLFNQSDAKVPFGSSVNLRISAADYDDVEIQVHLDRQRPDGIWESLANYRVSGNSRNPGTPNQAADWNRDYSTILDQAGTWTFRLTAFDFPKGRERQGNTETFTVSVSASEGGFRALIWIATLLLLSHLLILEISRLFGRKLDSSAATISGLIVFGLICYASFWAYYFNRWLGVAYSALVAGSLLLCVGRHLYSERNLAGYIQSTKLLLPVTSTALILLFIGVYPFSSNWGDLKLPAHRWLDLPFDNELPKLFADQIWTGNIKHPMVLDWLSSDRPPLQAGMYLLFKPLAPDISGIYQVVSTWAQCTILIPFVMILREVGVLRRTGALAILAISICPSLVVNGLFVWPKLLAGTFTAVYYIGLFPLRDTKIGVRERTLWCAGGATLALLSHGAAVFALGGITLAYLFQEGRKGIALIARSAAIGAAIYLPWVLYQKFADPPGDRLLSYHLAGEEHPNGRPFLEILRNAYSSISFDQWWDARCANIETIFSGSGVFFHDIVRVVSHALHGEFEPKTLVVNSFFFVGYSLGFFTGGATIAALIGGLLRNSPDQPSLKPLFWSLTLSAAVWSILLFPPIRAVLHVGPYFFAFGTMALSMAITRRCGIAAFNILCLLNLCLFLAGYVFDRELTYPRTHVFDLDPVYIVGAITLLTVHFFACRMVAKSLSDSSRENESESLPEGRIAGITT